MSANYRFIQLILYSSGHTRWGKHSPDRAEKCPVAPLPRYLWHAALPPNAVYQGLRFRAKPFIQNGLGCSRHLSLMNATPAASIWLHDSNIFLCGAAKKIVHCRAQALSVNSQGICRDVNLTLGCGDPILFAPSALRSRSCNPYQESLPCTGQKLPSLIAPYVTAGS